MASFSDDIAADLERQIKEQYDRTIEIPDGLTEDQAVAYFIDAYRKETGAELTDADVRPEIRKKMEGRETT
ncbi:hypothetical protein CRM90_09090 [Mycobacterium sp. ENV421]|uniref:hypothetical protein n=1 Tax=Mycobacterium sp. ENV421 TaxID=1213407 RepID=UPI000C9A2F89|nr:hypothetical protein [Mycobacterium sp. ENV421]PND58131.1 hypothetical protein CRM90_09090 [Mycobacterium sp. ENV421]